MTSARSPNAPGPDASSSRYAAAGTGSVAASVVAWLTLPLLGWFLYLTALAVYSVFDVSPFVAVALAMLPDAVLLFIVIALLVATSL